MSQEDRLNKLECIRLAMITNDNNGGSEQILVDAQKYYDFVISVPKE